MLDPGAPHHEDLAGYLLGALEPGEQAAFAVHLAGCPLCRADVADLGGLPRLLGQAAAPSAVPASLRERTLGAIRRAAGSS
jgi:anti-sigma factor RsiW